MTDEVQRPIAEAMQESSTPTPRVATAMTPGQLIVRVVVILIGAAVGGVLALIIGLVVGLIPIC